MADLLNKQGFECSVKNNEFFLNHPQFSIMINDSSSVLIGDDSYLNEAIKSIKKESYEMVYKAICSKKKLLKNDMFNFINLELNPLIFQCFHGFKVDFSRISERLAEKNISSVFSKNVFSAWRKNTHYSIKLDADYSINDADFSLDFFKLKNDELFMGFPYSIKFMSNPFKGFVYNGNLKEFKEISYALIDELAKEFI